TFPQRLGRPRAEGTTGRCRGLDRWQARVPGRQRQGRADPRYARARRTGRAPATRPGVVELPSEWIEPLLHTHMSIASADPPVAAILPERLISFSAHSADTSNVRSASF